MRDNLTPRERAERIVAFWIHQPDEQEEIRREITAAIEAAVAEEKQREAALEARLSQSVENGQSYHPEFCPVTGRSFFMTIEGEDGKMVATYGGPFDSYTIPEWDHEEKEFRSERFDHDAGHWVEGGEPYDFIIVDEQEYFEMKAALAEAKQREESMRGHLAAAREALEQITNLDQSYDREGDYSHGLAQGHTDAAEMAQAALAAGKEQG